LGVLALLNFTSFVKDYGYVAIFVLSVLQSCCVPTSSELTIGFAGTLAAGPKPSLNLAAVIIVAAVGELVGAYIAWTVGRYGGRTVVDRYGRYILLSNHDLDRAEAWYDRHGSWGVLASRCVPVIRNFVAVPAGVAEVPVVRFGILTLIGSLVWDGAMAGIGYGLSGTYQKIMHDVSYAGYVIAVLVVIFIAFVIWHRWRSFHAGTAGTSGTAGIAGTSGTAGTAGSSGTAGIAGSSGERSSAASGALGSARAERPAPRSSGRTPSPAAPRPAAKSSDGQYQPRHRRP
jgi:membrane protein DedA with SNARE-associated domain